MFFESDFFEVPFAVSHIFELRSRLHALRESNYRIAIIDREDETQKKTLEKFVMRRVHSFRRGADACGAHRRDSSLVRRLHERCIECESRMPISSCVSLYCAYMTILGILHYCCTVIMTRQHSER